MAYFITKTIVKRQSVKNKQNIIKTKQAGKSRLFCFYNETYFSVSTC